MVMLLLVQSMRGLVFCNHGMPRMILMVMSSMLHNKCCTAALPYWIGTTQHPTVATRIPSASSTDMLDNLALFMHNPACCTNFNATKLCIVPLSTNAYNAYLCTYNSTINNGAAAT